MARTFGAISVTNPAHLRALTPAQKAEFERLAAAVPSQGFSMDLNSPDDILSFLQNPTRLIPDHLKPAFEAATGQAKPAQPEQPVAAPNQRVDTSRLDPQTLEALAAIHTTMTSLGSTRTVPIAGVGNITVGAGFDFPEADQLFGGQTQQPVIEQPPTTPPPTVVDTGVAGDDSQPVVTGPTINPVTGAITTDPVIDPDLNPITGGPDIPPPVLPKPVAEPVVEEPVVEEPTLPANRQPTGPIAGGADFSVSDVNPNAPLPQNRVISTIDEQLTASIPNLNFDSEAVRDARTATIERQAAEGRNQIARRFALDPSGLQQGRAIRVGAEFEGARLGALSGLEEELAQRASAENRANIQTLGGLRLGERSADVSEGGLNLQSELGRGQLGLQERGQLFGEDVATAGLTGQFQGAQTVQEQQRGFENMLAESQLFGGETSTEFIGVDAFTPAIGKSRGEPGYNPNIDLNQDGRITTDDYNQFLAQGSAGAGPNGEFGIAADVGRKTLAQQQLNLQARDLDKRFQLASERLGIDKAQLEEATRQFDTNFRQSASEFLTNTTGFVYDPASGEPVGTEITLSEFGPEDVGSSVTIDGVPYLIGAQNPDGTFRAQNEQTGVITERLSSSTVVNRPMTTLQRDSFNENRRQFDSQLNQDFNIWLDQFGLKLDELDQQETSFYAELFIDAFKIIGQTQGWFGTNAPATTTQQRFTVGIGDNGLGRTT